MQKFTILVVDDDPAIRHLPNELLTSNPDYRVLLAGDSKEAVRAFHDERKIDVVLTDIHMLFVTSGAQEPVQQNAGCREWISKSVAQEPSVDPAEPFLGDCADTADIRA